MPCSLWAKEAIMKGVGSRLVILFVIALCAVSSTAMLLRQEMNYSVSEEQNII